MKVIKQPAPPGARCHPRSFRAQPERPLACTSPLKRRRDHASRQPGGPWIRRGGNGLERLLPIQPRPCLAKRTLRSACSSVWRKTIRDQTECQYV